MAGLWERVRGDVGETYQRIGITLLRTEVTAVALGVKSQAEARTVIEAEYGITLDAAELADLSAIVTQISTGTTQDRLVYAAKLEYALIAAELVQIDETSFRSVLGI